MKPLQPLIKGLRVAPFVADLMKRLGKYKTGKSCLYVKKLADLNVNVLKELATKPVNKMEPKRILE